MAVLANRAWMTTATTGTGTLTLASAFAGHQSFADAGILNGQTVSYTIVDGSSWEVGTGVYTTSGTTLTRNVNESSNSDSALNLSGTAAVFISARKQDVLSPLDDNTTFNVRPGGSDAVTRSGLVNDDDNAFATLQYAFDTIKSRYNFNGKTVTIQVADSTYAPASGTPVLTINPWYGGGALAITGNTSTPANCILSTTSADCIKLATTSGAIIDPVTINGFELRTTTSGSCINNQSTGHLQIGSAMRFGTCAGLGQILVSWRAAQIHASGYSIVGAAVRHIDCDAGIVQLDSGTITVSGTPAFSGAFARFRNHGCLISDATWSGSATGKRFSGEGNALCNVGSADENHFPGNSAGTCISGAVYEGATTISGVQHQTVTGLLDISGASAGQIKFPATQNASANANTLDDYEEGTWTPVLTFATPGDQSIAYASRSGTYTKIGRMVTAKFLITTSTFTHTTASGNLNVTGFPFAAGGTGLGVLEGFQGITKANYTQFGMFILSTATLCAFQASGSAQTLANLTTSDMPTGGTVVLNGELPYFV